MYDQEKKKSRGESSRNSPLFKAALLKNEMELLVNYYANSGDFIIFLGKKCSKIITDYLTANLSMASKEE